MYMHVRTYNLCLENLLFYLLETLPSHSEVKEKAKERDGNDGKLKQSLKPHSSQYFISMLIHNTSTYCDFVVNYVVI